MRFDTSQHMRMSQQMKLAPRMIQSMEILQMPLAELEERIEQELESNATLEVAQAEPEGEGESSGEGSAGAEASREARDAREGSAESAEEFERLDEFQADTPEWAENEFSDVDRAERSQEYEPRTRRLEGEPDAKSEAMASAPARAASLSEQLLDQWRLSDVDPSLRGPGEAIITFIEDDGYLRTPLETIIDRMAPGADGVKPGAEVMARALQAVQVFLDPPGVGARDVRECLLLQVDALEDAARSEGGDAGQWRTVRLLIEHHLDDLAQNRLPRVAERAGLTMPELRRAMDLMGHLRLAPGRDLTSETPRAIIPDAIVEYDADHDRYFAYLNDSRLPSLRINREYAQMARDRGVDRRTREFLKVNMSNAQWLLEAVEQRRRTLQRVINAVLEAQRDFFDFGPAALRPLPMTQVADQLGIHVATVSRAVADKHLQTPRGIVRLRDFFSGGTQTASGEDLSWDAVRAALKEVIDAEDKGAPLSDDALSAELKKRGIDIARRTVAKYRDQLNIPSARLRKAH